MPMSTAPTIASPFALIATDGRPYALSEHKGGPLVISFFKTTCPTCMLTFPYLERLYQTYRAQGLTVWGISQDPLDDSLAFAADYGVTFPVLLDTTWDVSNAYGVDVVPTTFLLDRRGQIAFSFVSFSKDDINEMARLIAAETQAPLTVIAPPDDGKPPFRPG
jgi:peroxiredoxin